MLILDWFQLIQLNSPPLEMQKMFLLCQTPAEALKQHVKFKAWSYLGWNPPSLYLLEVESDINFLADRFLILAQLKQQTFFCEVFSDFIQTVPYCLNIVIFQYSFTVECDMKHFEKHLPWTQIFHQNRTVTTIYWCQPSLFYEKDHSIRLLL